MKRLFARGIAQRPSFTATAQPEPEL